MSAKSTSKSTLWFQRYVLPGLVLKSVIIGGGYATGREFGVSMTSTVFAGFLTVILGATTAGAASDRQPVDLLIRGGTVVDGTGMPSRRADVAVKDGRIVAVEPDLQVTATSYIDASGLTVAPGFIDGHNHSDEELSGTAPCIHLNEWYVRQGVTTIVGGPDGGVSPADLNKLLEGYRRTGIGTNVAFYVGHNAIRAEVMGQNQARAPGTEELEKMRDLVREGMRAGMVGLSTGLMYTPGLFSETDEIIALAREVAPFGGVYQSHVRDPHRALLQSNWEAIEVGRQAHIPVNLTHLTTPGRNHRGLMKAVIEQIEDARREGVRVVADQYPYHAVATGPLSQVLSYPAELQPNGLAQVRAALSNPVTRARIRDETLTGGASGFSHYKASGPSSLLIMVCPGCESLQGKFISEIASARSVGGFDVIADLILGAPEAIIASAGGFFEEDMQALMRQPWTMIASDGYALSQGQGGHPRSTGTFPRVLGVYVRELKLLTLTDAVRKMTSAPADFLGLSGRGRLAPGNAADVVIFDAQRIIDRSTWRNPTALPLGMVHVIVNGKPVLKDGVMTGNAPGAYLRRGGGAESLEQCPNRSEANSSLPACGLSTKVLRHE